MFAFEYMSCSVGLRRSDSVVLGACRRRESRELREKVLWTSRASSVSQGTYLLFDLPYTCRLSEDTAVLVVATLVQYSYSLGTRVRQIKYVISALRYTTS